ncbi:MAG: beta-ketoacyl-[acyl-carrier-protein] synthase family protein [Opitutales bacterium]|nr:beta-ketoacyl-[acyl-carrier-protein] synthase family protein [Opitutales bacterium]
MKNAVITGLGFITSIGNDYESVKDALINLKNGIVLYPPFAADNIPVKCVGTVKDFDTSSTDQEDWIYPQNYRVRRDVIRGFAPHCLYAYCAMKQAIEDANLTDEDVSNVDTGMFTASAGSTTMLYEGMKKLDASHVSRANPFGIVSYIAGTLSFNLVSAFKIKGASCGFVSACASSSHELGYAFDEIALGRHKRMFVVGGEDGDYRTLLPFAGMRALSTSDDPETASRPFDKNRNGFVGCGGGVVMVVEEEEMAKARGAKIYARIRGWGQASDGYNVAIPHPQGDGVVNAVTRALQSANIQPQQVEYINAHATSTPIGDRAELKAIKKVFGENAKADISSTKAITGHGLSLAGVMEAAFCALAIKEGFTPASAHITELDEETQGLNILMKTKMTAPQIAVSLSSGFGGANTVIVFEKID